MASTSGPAEQIGTIQDMTPRIELGLSAPAAIVLENVVVDTGFAGALGVPAGFFRFHGIRSRGVTPTELADGTTKLCPMASLTVRWLVEHRRVAALELGRETLVGMELLNHSRIEFDG